MVIDTIYKVLRIGMSVIGIASLLLFIFSLRAQTGKRTMTFRIITATLVCISILVLIFATSPFSFYAPAPTSPSAQIVGLKNDNELFTLRVSDGDLKTITTSLISPRDQDYHNSIAFINNGVAYIRIARSYGLQTFRLSDGSSPFPYPNLTNTYSLLNGDIGYFSTGSGIEAVNMRTQTQIWFHSDESFEIPGYRGAGAIIGLDSGMLYTETGDSLIALRASDGAFQWSFDLSAQFPAFTSFRFMLQAGAVYITGQQDANYELLKVAGGKIVWRLVSASALSADSNRLYIGISIPHEEMWQIAAVNISDGHIIWKLPFAGQPNAVKLPLTILHSSSPTSSPTMLYSLSSAGPPSNLAVANGILYFAGEDDSAGETNGTCAAFAIRGEDGARLWEQSTDLCNANHIAYMGYLYGEDAVIIGNGIVYLSFIEKGGYVNAFNAATGKALWSDTGILEGLFSGAAVIYVNPTSCEVWQLSCDTKDTSEAYFDVRNPQTGARYWRYQATGVTNFLVTANT